MTDKQPEALSGMQAQSAPAYKDSTPELHIGDSAFESWYSTYSPAHKSDKQRARDAYAAGMGDPLVTAAHQQEAQEVKEPVAWYVTGCSRLLDEDEAKAEARHIGGTARAMPLYTAPQADSYFEARPQIDSNDRRKVFQAGFERGWDAARKQGANHD